MHSQRPSPTPRPLPTHRSRSRRTTAWITAALIAAMIAPLVWASGAGGRYRQHGRYRGANQPPPQQRYLQPTLSGIRPPNFGKFQNARPNAPNPGVTQRLNHAPVHPPHGPVVYVPISSYVPVQPQTQPVVVVQQPPPPPPQQPILVMVPPQPTPEVAPPPAPRPKPAAVPQPPAKPKEPGVLRFAIQPSDATVYLDDRRLGNGEELLDADPMSFAAGVHVLEVSHPDHPDERLVFGLGSAGDLHIAVDLLESKPTRRTQLSKTTL